MDYIVSAYLTYFYIFYTKSPKNKDRAAQSRRSVFSPYFISFIISDKLLKFQKSALHQPTCTIIEASPLSEISYPEPLTVSKYGLASSSGTSVSCPSATV